MPSVIELLCCFRLRRSPSLVRISLLVKISLLGGFPSWEISCGDFPFSMSKTLSSLDSWMIPAPEKKPATTKQVFITCVLRTVELENLRRSLLVANLKQKTICCSCPLCMNRQANIFIGLHLRNDSCQST